MNNHTITIKDEKLLKVGEYKVVGRKVVFKTRDLWGFLDNHMGFPIGFIGFSLIWFLFQEVNIVMNIIAVLCIFWILYVDFGKINRTEIVGTLKEIKNGK